MDGGIEVFGADGDQARSRRGLPAVVAVVAAIAAVVALFDLTAPRSEVAAGSAAPEEPLRFEATETRALADIVPGFQGRLAVAVANPGGGAAEVITWHAAEADPARMGLGALTGLRFDAGGTWVAGSAASPDGRRLWLGRTGGGIFPLDRRIEGFAWHDSEPASLAYTATTGDGVGLFVSDLLVGGTTLVSADLPATRLKRWGDWGFGLSLPGPAYRTAVLRLDGRSPILRVGGCPVGGLPDGRVAFSPISPPEPPVVRFPRPFALNTSSGSVTFPSWVGPEEYPWAIETSPDRSLVAAHVTTRPFSAYGAVVRIFDAAGTVLMEIEGVAAPPAMAWDRSGRFLVVAVEGEVRTELAVVDVEGGGTATLPPLVGSRSVIQDLAVLER